MLQIQEVPNLNRRSKKSSEPKSECLEHYPPTARPVDQLSHIYHFVIYIIMHNIIRVPNFAAKIWAPSDGLAGYAQGHTLTCFEQSLF